jgi:hypothetical protein
MIGAALRQKNDQEWRNLTGISKYENRKREYLKLSWQQTNTKTLNTKLIFDYQQREYTDHDIKDKGYALSQSINLHFSDLKLSFTGGVFHTKIPLYLYLYSGRLNNPLIVLTSEGQYAMFSFNYKILKQLQIEVMNTTINKNKTENTASGLVAWSF